MTEQNLERTIHQLTNDEDLWNLFEAEKIKVQDIIDFTKFDFDYSKKYGDFAEDWLSECKRTKELVIEIVEDGISTISQHGVGTSEAYIQDIYYDISTNIQLYECSKFFPEHNESGTTRKPDNGEFQKHKNMLVQAGIWQGD